jgi:hypothetical protein
VVVAVVAAEPGGSVGVGLVSGALLASAGFVWPRATPSVGCCCWPMYCWPDCCSGFALQWVSESNRTPNNHNLYSS